MSDSQQGKGDGNQEVIEEAPTSPTRRRTRYNHCPICQLEAFETAVSLSEHIRRKHPEVVPKTKGVTKRKKIRKLLIRKCFYCHEVVTNLYRHHLPRCPMKPDDRESDDIRVESAEWLNNSQFIDWFMQRVSKGPTDYTEGTKKTYLCYIRKMIGEKTS